MQEEAKNNGAWAYIEPRFETTAAKAKVIRSVIAKVGGKAVSWENSQAKIRARTIQHISLDPVWREGS